MNLHQDWKNELVALVNHTNGLTLNESDVNFSIANKDEVSGAVSVVISPGVGSPYFNEQSLVYVPRDAAKALTGIPLRFIVGNDTTLRQVITNLAERYGISFDQTVDFTEEELNKLIDFTESGIVDVDVSFAPTSFVWAGKLSLQLSNSTLDLQTLIRNAALFSLRYPDMLTDGQSNLALATLGTDFSKHYDLLFSLPMYQNIDAVTAGILAQEMIDQEVIPVEEKDRVVAALTRLYIAQRGNDGVNYTVQTSVPFMPASGAWGGRGVFQCGAVVAVQTMQIAVEPGRLYFKPNGARGSIAFPGGRVVDYDDTDLKFVLDETITTPGIITFKHYPKDYSSVQILTGSALKLVLSWKDPQPKITFYQNYPEITASELIDVPANIPANWTYLDNTFREAKKFVGNNVRQWDVSKIWNFNNLFYGCSVFNADISDWKLSNDVRLDRMFANCTAFNQPVGEWKVAAGSANGTFMGATAFNQPLNDWKMSSCTDISYMFQNATSFNQDLSSWDLSNVTDMNGVFYGATAFNGNISTWKFPNVTTLNTLFFNAASFNGDISQWDVSKITDFNMAFAGCTVFNQDLSGWDTSNVTDMGSMFTNSGFNGNISGWDVSKVTNMSYMFYNTTLFDQDLSGWEVGNVTDIGSMFAASKAFNSPPPNKWTTALTRVWGVFSQTEVFNQPIVNWNTSNVTEFTNFFEGAKAFDQPLNDFDVSNALALSGFFQRTGKFNQPLDNWNVSKCTNMMFMFNDSKAFDQDLSGWDVGNVTEFSYFSGGSPLRNEFRPRFGSSGR